MRPGQVVQTAKNIHGRAPVRRGTLGKITMTDRDSDDLQVETEDGRRFWARPEDLIVILKHDIDL